MALEQPPRATIPTDFGQIKIFNAFDVSYNCFRQARNLFHEEYGTWFKERTAGGAVIIHPPWYPFRSAGTRNAMMEGK